MKKKIKIVKIGGVTLLSIVILWSVGILFELGISAINKPSTTSLLGGILLIGVSLIIVTLLGSTIFDMIQRNLYKEENKEKSDNE